MRENDNECVSPSLRRLCRAVRAGAAVGALVGVGTTAWLWTSPDAVAALGPRTANLGCIAVNSDPTTRALGAALSTLPLALWLALAWQLWRLFGLYADGLALTARAQRLLQRFALTLLALAVVTPLYRSALSVVLTLMNPPGQRTLVFGVGSDDYLWVLVGAALLAVATVMRQAVAAADENRRFV